MWGSLASLCLSLASWLLLLLFLGLLVAFLVFCAYVKYMHMKYDHIPGPPRDSFLFGHTYSLKKALDNLKVTHDLYLRWAEEYGPVVRLNFMHYVFLIVTSPEAVKEYMMSSKYPKDPDTYNRLFYIFGKRFMGKGLVTDPDHEHWYKQRRIMDPAFSNTYLREMVGVFNERAECLMERLAEKADGKQQVGLHSIINCVTMDVITKVAFGMELGLTEGNKSDFPNAVALALEGMIKYMQNPFMQYMPQHRAYVRSVEECAVLLRNTGRECIEQRKRAKLNGEELPKDILTKILECADEQNGLDDEVMLDNFVTFFVAGQETTANQLSFTMMELTRQPEITQRLRAEIDEVIGFKRDLSYDDITNLTYMTQVLKESLRLYPPAPGTTRYIKDDAVIEGIKIPGGVPLMFDSYVMGRLEKFFPDPYKFHPERFSPSAPKPYYCYFPFALGPRSCLGQVFSQLEARVVLSKLLQRFEFSLVPGQSYEVMDTGTLRPRDGVVCTLTLRPEAS
ncbi:cholesterol 24-hydroxylase-like isoform X1 [Hyla sarda]|uniref:cholesterol 24-hydroxylase-like isoform X1 n=2 Tax=Hyla sarda TaxID=327740 RepID=UPI0024C2F37B|nr:cholesterol 24-hydroxylase-like isoform X1 [Hyla sarda]XP_056401607.1 cholesterol 24-hydroxylase-like isoform X1 [Hyla sarda]XP_056401608.1 cholesterol 24-hydroxylase-like isoform X1 [Hyla sarda]XP_056401609.1 cholesterol 24-hydroxylase-like isoform X1 [Hyla sarda]